MARTPAPNRRSAPTKVSKPFPWGVVAGSAVLALFLGGILFYAATNQGAGQDELLTNPDQAIEGIQLVDKDELTRDHVAGPVDYPEMPPAGGNHNAAPQQCDVYDAEIAPEHAVHSLEHGAVWITYREGLAQDQVDELAGKVEGDPYGLMSPLAEQDSPIVLTAWGRHLPVDSADDPRIDDFLKAYTSGPQTPERGSACIGNTTTGPVQGAAPDGTIQPTPAASAPAAPAAPATPAPAASPAG